MSRADGSVGASGELEVRRFVAGDTDAVRRLHAAERKGAAAHLGRDQFDQDLDSTAAAYLDDGGEFLVGLSDGRLVAIGALRHVTDIVAEVRWMRVHPGYQRRGYARLILAGLEHRAHELGYRQLRLDTTIMQIAAQGLYAGAGYRQVGRGQLAGVDVVYFAKTLT